MPKQLRSDFQRDVYRRREKEITTASLTVFERQGCFGFRVEDIAEEAGVPKGSIYAHYESKTQVLEATAEQVEADIVAEYQRRLRELPPETALAAKLALIGEILLGLNSRGKPHRVAIYPRLQCALENCGHVSQLHPLDDLIASIIEDGSRHGHLRSDLPPRALAHLFLAIVGSPPMREMARVKDPQQTSRKAVDFFFDGARV